MQPTRNAKQSADDSAPQLALEPETRWVVYPGDTLWGIAQERLGPNTTPQQVVNEVERIYQLNSAQLGAYPGLLLPGQKLLLPSVAAPAAPVPRTEPNAADLQPEPRPIEEPNPLPKASPTTEEDASVAGFLPEPDNTARRLTGLVILVFTLFVAILGAWKLPMRRYLKDPGAWGTSLTNANYYLPSGGLGDYEEKQVPAPGAKRLLRNKGSAAEAYSPQVRRFFKYAPRTGPRRRAAAKKGHSYRGSR
jgi:hypothetical protein